MRYSPARSAIRLFPVIPPLDQVGLQAVHRLVLQEGQRALGQLDVLPGHDRQAGGPSQRHPRLGKSARAGPRKERLDRLYRLGHLDGAGHVQLVVAVNNDVDLVAQCLAGERIGQCVTLRASCGLMLVMFCCMVAAPNGWWISTL